MAGGPLSLLLVESAAVATAPGGAARRDPSVEAAVLPLAAVLEHDLLEAQADLLHRERVARADFLTLNERRAEVGYGPVVVYQEKRREAELLAEDADPQPADYPLLSAEIGITGPDLASVGVKILATANAWAQIAARIEAARLGAKRAIDDVPDSPNARADIDGVLAGIDWVA